MFGLINGVKFAIWNKKGCFNCLDDRKNCRKESHSIWIKKYNTKVYIRPFTTDFKVLRDFFLIDCYDNEYYKKELPYDINFKGKLNEKEVKYIVDSGANIGMFTVIYANKFPEARILCIEPERENYLNLKKNMEKFSNVQCIQTGIWSSDSSLKICENESGSIGFYVRKITEGEDADTYGRSISSLMKEFGFPYIDILKMDIEGAEYEVFKSGEYRYWIDKVKVLIIETHERYRMGTERLIEKVMKEHGFINEKVNEDIVWYRNNE